MIPEFLYQYTTMKSVLAILENKTIRFTRLDALNDLKEGCCGIYPHFKKYVYISSWGADERESIPMWSLYGKKNDVLDEGVRIKVPSNLFSFDGNGDLCNTLKLEKILGGWNAVTDVETKDIVINECVKEKLKDVATTDKFLSEKKVVGPVKVNYLSFLNYYEKYKSILKQERVPNFYSFAPKSIGYEKIDDWAYENEYRFWMQFPHCNMIAGDENVMKNDITFTKFPYIDVYYNEKAISEMEIMLSPNFNMDKLETFISELREVGFKKDLQKSSLDVRI